MNVLRSICLVSVLAAAAAGQATPKKISHAEAMGAVVTKIQPEYPALARQLKLSGSVELDILIGESGSVESVTPISGNPVLTKPAAEALKKWKFKPFLQDGSPVKAEAAVKINFGS
jgi:protein TonB